MTQRKIQYWVIPPEADAEFIASMEEVLDTYEAPYNSEYPVLCMDEQPIQLHREIRKPIPATRKHARRVDYEYELCGTASIFMFTEPLSGWREVRVRDQRTKVDWAIEMERLLTTRYRSARKVIVVCDNLNTHTKGAFYETFPAVKARSLVRRNEFSQTPKHGSWLNIAENELSTMTRQCVTGRRFESTRPLRAETKAWGWGPGETPGPTPLFLGSKNAGPRAAVLSTILAGAKRHRIEPLGLRSRTPDATTRQ